ncbi:MAG: hypothetical protein D6730_12340 [Bacteroidetes bacterium]|nr:MAG: hypothetical protein D6730_12340 [Bacteroidota bacterium]
MNNLLACTLQQLEKLVYFIDKQPERWVRGIMFAKNFFLRKTTTQACIGVIIFGNRYLFSIYLLQKRGNMPIVPSLTMHT